MKKIFLVLVAAIASTGAFAEGYQVNNMSAKQTGMGHVGTAMQLNSESIFFNPAATAFQKSKFDISVGFTGILSNAHFQTLPYPSMDPEQNYKIGQIEKSDNGLSTPMHMYFNFKPHKRWAVGLGFYVPDGSSMNWGDHWSGSHLIQNIELKAFTFQPTVSFKVTENFSIGAGLTITWGNFDLKRSVFRIGAGQELAGFLKPQGHINPLLMQMVQGHVQDYMQRHPGVIQPSDLQGAMNDLPATIDGVAADLDRRESLISARLHGNANVAVGVNAGFLWNINEQWSVGMTWRSRQDMKVSSGASELIYNKNLENAIGRIMQYAGKHRNVVGPLLADKGISLQDLANMELPKTMGTFATELPLPTSVTWGVSFRPTSRWEFGVDLQWVGWSAYDKLTVNFVNKEEPLISVKNYSNTLAFRFGGQFDATKFLTARMGFYVDQSPVDSNYLNPETPSMTKVSYTAGLSLRPSKCMSIDLAYCYVSSADPERIGTYPYENNANKIHNQLHPDQKIPTTEKFEGNYSLHANVFSVGLNFHF